MIMSNVKYCNYKLNFNMKYMKKMVLVNMNQVSSNSNRFGYLLAQFELEIK